MKGINEEEIFEYVHSIEKKENEKAVKIRAL